MTYQQDYWIEYFEKAKNEILPENFEHIKNHIRRMKAADMRERTLANHYEVLTNFGKWCKKPFTALTPDDMLDYSDWLDRQACAPAGRKKKELTNTEAKAAKIKKLSAGTKYARQATVKAFLKNINTEAATAIKAKMTHARKLPEDLLTKEDIEALLDFCPNARDRSLIAFLYESGARKGEMFSIRIKNVQFDENGTVITIPEGKTGARRIRLIFATSYLREWIEVHPCKHDRDAILFCSLREPYPRLTDEGLRDQLTKIAGKAGIMKRVNAHAFRHARATHLAEHLTEQQLKKYLGWTEGSNMAAVYVHLSGKDIDKAILKMNGLASEETTEDNALKIIKCPRCKDIQDAKARYCNKCGLPLSEVSHMELEADKNVITEISLQLQQIDPEVLNILLKAIQTAKS